MLTNLVLTLQVSATTYCRIQKFTAVNAAGDVTPPFLAINGLNVREMPKLADGDDGTVVLNFHSMVSGAHKIPSLRHPDARHAPGRIVFARRSELGTKVGESASGKIARIHNDLVVLPFIKSIQQGNGHLAGTKYEAKDTVLLYRDGCGPALEEDRRPDKLDENARRCIIHVKGNPAATAVQQVCLPACVPPDCASKSRDRMNYTHPAHSKVTKLVIEQKFRFSKHTKFLCPTPNFSVLSF